jgi:hypothetical protein
MLDIENDFTFIRCHLLNKPTATEQQIASQIVKTIDSLTDDTINNPLIQRQLEAKSKCVGNLIIH